MIDFFEEIIVIGINSVIKRNQNQDLKNALLSECPEIIESRLSRIDLDIQKDILEGIFVKNPAVFYEDAWVNYVDTSLARFTGATNSFVYNNGSWFVLLNRIKDMREDGGVDWFNVLCSLSSATVEQGSLAPGFETVLGWLVDANQKFLLKLLHRSETKRYPRSLKASLYRRLIDYGLLDTKIARRIRSDTCGELSHKILAYLFENRGIYSDDDFQSLITQFSDTKHKWVARYIALNIPIDLAPFLMGLKDRVAMSIIEKRMNADDED